MIYSNFMDNVNANEGVSASEHMAMCIKLMRRTENESPDKVIQFSLTTADIILRALLLPNLIPHSFLRELPTGDISVRNITSELGWSSWRQPGLSICIISDRDLINSWAQEIIVGYDIVIVHTDDEHFVT